MRALYGDSLPATATAELCRDPEWLMSVNALYLATYQDGLLGDFAVRSRKRGASVFSTVSPFGVTIRVRDELDEPPPTPLGGLEPGPSRKVAKGRDPNEEG